MASPGRRSEVILTRYLAIRVLLVRLLPDWSELAHIVRLFWMCHQLLAFRFLPASLHRLHHLHHDRLYRYLPVFCFGRFLTFHLGCLEGFHPTGRTSRLVRVGSAIFLKDFARCVEFRFSRGLSFGLRYLF